MLGSPPYHESKTEFTPPKIVKFLRIGIGKNERVTHENPTFWPVVSSPLFLRRLFAENCNYAIKIPLMDTGRGEVANANRAIKDITPIGSVRQIP